LPKVYGRKIGYSFIALPFLAFKFLSPQINAQTGIVLKPEVYGRVTGGSPTFS